MNRRGRIIGAVISGVAWVLTSAVSVAVLYKYGIGSAIACLVGGLAFFTVLWLIFTGLYGYDET